MSLSLTDQYAVEWIAMQSRQAAQPHYGSFIQPQRRDQVVCALLGDKLGGRVGQRKFAEAVFEANFPE